MKRERERGKRDEEREREGREIKRERARKSNAYTN